MKMKSIALFLLGATVLTSCIEAEKESQEKQAPTFENSVDSLSYVLGMGYSAPMAELEMVLTNSGSDKAFVQQLLQGIKDGVRGGDKEKLAYYIGLRSGMNMRTEIIGEAEAQLFGEDTTRHMNIENFIAGFLDVTEDKFDFKVDGKLLHPKDAADYVQDILSQTFIEQQQEQYPEQFEANNAFLIAKAKEAGIDSLDNGILYKVINPGKGPKPSGGNIVSIEYKGSLIDSTCITMSHAITDVAVRNGIINFPGFEMLITNMPLGAEWEAYIPWKLCYGAHGNSDIIPPFSNIIFRVKLHNIK